MGMSMYEIRDVVKGLAGDLRMDAGDLRDALATSPWVGAPLDYRRVHIIQGPSGEIRLSSERTVYAVRYLSILGYMETTAVTLRPEEIWSRVVQGEEVPGLEIPALTGEEITMDDVVSAQVIEEIWQAEETQITARRRQEMLERRRVYEARG
jgi:hypothetical protein